MSTENELANYFEQNEVELAKAFIEIFHGNMLVTGELGRVEAVLLSIYMLCNYKKSNSVKKNELQEFSKIKLGIDPTDYSKGLYDLKKADFVAENGDSINLKFDGLKRVREMLSAGITRTKVKKPNSITE
jgi:hypothetical protein